MNRTETSPQVAVAILDDQALLIGNSRQVLHVYHGVQLLDASEVTPNHVRVPEDCDLSPGGYFWNGECFCPTPDFIAKNRPFNKRGA